MATESDYYEEAIRFSPVPPNRGYQGVPNRALGSTVYQDSARKTPAGEMVRNLYDQRAKEWARGRADYERQLQETHPVRELGAAAAAPAQAPASPLTRAPAPRLPANTRMTDPALAQPNRGSAVTSVLTQSPSTAPNARGTITMGGLTRVYPGVGQLAAPPPTPVASPTTVQAPQTESRNPLSGASNAQPAGSTGPVAAPPMQSAPPAVQPSPARALGASSRGSAVPSGQDALDGGGNAPAAGAEPPAGGLMTRRFARPEQQAFYDSVARALFSPAAMRT